ncbi:hypothetical protein [Sphingomonas sp. Y38-1Y]|uniref:hypothetical protein n=1 Tax=Sphingomonas sp. Y38-1Y TaxID=3078265 RepID=UPI0028EB18C5|nr:hypothetical protein [Sphingomonas sp. Y38-1Y]
MEPQDRNYFLSRASQEQAFAERCEDVTARRVHQELADRYRTLADQAPMMAAPPRAA